jgi:hypothetical protein
MPLLLFDTAVLEYDISLDILVVNQTNTTLQASRQCPS